MSRTRLREAIAGREAAAAPAVVPRLERLAARLEQVPDGLVARDPEVLARAVRNAQALFGSDAVTVGGSEPWLALACRAVTRPDAVNLLPGEALVPLPDPSDVVAAPQLSVLVEALRRLRPVLGERAGTAVVVPAPAALAGDLGADPDWAAAVVMAVLRCLGAEEPDLVLMTGEGPPDDRVASVAAFFGVCLVQPGHTPGVVALPAGAFGGDEPGGAPPGWLYTTTGELPPGSDPARVAEGLRRLRSGAVPAGTASPGDGGGER